MRLFHYMRADHGLLAVANQRIKVAEYSNLNDPYELNAADVRDRDIRVLMKSFAKDWSCRVGLCCFSKSWKEPLMWSHYADKHKGVVLEFEVNKNVTLPVRYSNEKVRFNIDQIAAKGFSEALANRLVMTKYSGWCYEKEVRICMQLSECEKDSELFFYRFDDDIRLVGMLLGPLSTVSIDDVARHAVGKPPLVVTKVRLGFGKFEITRDKRVAPKEVGSKLV